MPVRPEIRPLYPRIWPEISRRVRFERAGGRCEGCGRPHGKTIRCLPDGRWYDPERGTWRSGKGREIRWPDLIDVTQARTTRVILAAAHLNHQPECRRLRSLKAFCQRCHLNFDRPFHLSQRWITYRARYAIGDLFVGSYAELRFRWTASKASS